MDSLVSVFADANVLIAGCASRSGASHVVLMLAEAGLLELVVSRQVLDEAERNLQRKLPKGLPLLAEWLAHIGPVLLSDPQPHEFARWLPYIEAKDAPYLEAAVRFGADYFLALNSKDFTPENATRSKLTIMSPGDFVTSIRDVLGQHLIP